MWYVVLYVLPPTPGLPVVLDPTVGGVLLSISRLSDKVAPDACPVALDARVSFLPIDGSPSVGCGGFASMLGLHQEDAGRNVFRGRFCPTAPFPTKYYQCHC